MTAGPLSYRWLERPSKATIRAAKTAAASPHGLINLVRLVQALDVASEEEGDPPSQGARKDAETVQYARLLLDNLRDGNTQSSRTGDTLDQIDRKLQSVERQYQIFPSNVQKSAFLANPTHSPTPSRPVASSDAVSPSPVKSVPAATSLPPSRARRRNVDTAEYLRKRAQEDAAGAEVGLLALRVVPVNVEQSKRDQLLEGGGAGLGSRQLHEELGGQLADMSQRLKLNAIHFASSLNDEKDLLESSQGVLEKNLVATRSSKKALALVSKKGRGTTCMTLGVVVLVLVIFVWTYMLIRFT